MGNLIRRNKIIPVQTRRVPGEPEQVIINAPNQAPAPFPVNPPPQPSTQSTVHQPNVTTHNIFYITNPAPSAPPAPPPAAQTPPQEIHYHTTVHHAPRSRRPDKGTSLFGMLAVLLGGAACASHFAPQISPYAKFLAEAGLVAGGLGWLGAIVLRRVGAGMPIFGLIVSAAGFIVWLSNSGQLPDEVNKIKSQLPAGMPRIDIGSSEDLKNKPAHVPSAPSPVVPPKSNHSNDAPPKSPIVVDTPPVDLTALNANLESARLAAAKRLGVDYLTAKSDDEKAVTDLKQIRANNSPGSPELTAASERWMKADAELKRVQEQLRSDPAVAAGERAMKGAK